MRKNHSRHESLDPSDSGWELQLGFDSCPFSGMDYAIVRTVESDFSRQISGQGFERILVLKLRHLGDVLLATPVFRALKEARPKAEIYACVNEGTEHILEGNPDLAGILINKGAKGSGYFRSLRLGMLLVSQIRRKKFDACVDLTASDRSAVLTFLSGAPRRIGFEGKNGFIGRKFAYTERNRMTPQRHMVLNHLDLLRPLGITPKNPRLHLNVAESHQAKIRAMLEDRPFFQVHPISRLLKKNWPAEFVIQTVRHIARRGWIPVLTGSKSPDEMQAVEALGKEMGEHINLCGELSLLELGALSSQSQCYFGVDTGPMHVAASVGAPVIVLFGPTSETIWAPWCKDNLVLSLDMDCRLPCKNKACQHINCLRTLTPSIALPQIDRFIDQLSK